VSAKKRKKPSVLVIDDPARVEEARAEYRQEMEDLAEAVLARIERRDWLASEELAALRACLDDVAVELHWILEQEGGDAKEQMNVARILRQLCDPEGEDFIWRSLDSESPSHRAEALRAMRKWDCRIDLTDPERASRVVARINDPDPAVAAAAVELCSFREVDGTEAALTGHIARAKDPQEAATKLTRVASTPAAVRTLLPHLFRTRPPHYNQWTGFRMEKVLAHPDPEVSGPVREAFREYLLGFEGEDRYDQSLVHELAKTAVPQTIPILEDVREKATDPVSRAWAVEGLARLQPDQAVDLILEHISREGTWGMLDPLREHAADKDADHILAAILPTSGAGRLIETDAVRVLLEKLGERGRRVVQERFEELAPAAKMWATWKLGGIDLVSALNDLHAAGVIDLPAEEVLLRARQKRHQEEEGPLDVTDPRSLKAALDAAGVLTAFDAETDQTPDHDWLIGVFAEGTRGRFTPECPRQESGDEDGPFTVQFIDAGRLFRFEAENFGGWYDVEAVQRALNVALETAGRRERFIALQGDGQIAEFVFADPEVFVPLAGRYGVPLSDDPGHAMRRGQEYERM
jgi:hypothetical protein